MMNKRGQVGAIGVIFLILVFIILWFVWLGGWVADIGQQIILTNEMTGVEAFFFANLNIVILIGLIFGMMASIYLGSRI